MKKYFNLTLIILALVLCFSLAACNSGNVDHGEDAQSERVAVHTVELDVDTKDIAACLDDLTEKNLALGGFVENVSRDYNDGEMRRASIILRVPTEKKDELVEHIEDTYGVADKTEISNDVTKRYNTTIERKGMLEDKRAELEKLLDDIELSASDKITIINEIASVKSELAEIERKVGECEEDMRYSAVKVWIYEPAGFLETFLPLFTFFILPLGAAIISIWRATVKRNRAVRARREQEAKAAEAARMAQNNSQMH
jgi:predicted small secreted protein